MRVAENHQGVIRFIGYRMVDLQYHCDENYELPSDKQVPYSFSIGKKVEMLSATEMQVNLRATVLQAEEEIEEQAPYMIAVEIVGRFIADTPIDPKWETNALAILFPYIRSIVSSVTAQSGREPIILPTVNLVQMFSDAEDEDN